jgi:hypothetical protein
MQYDPYSYERPREPARAALDEGNIPGTPSTKGTAIVIVALLIGVGLLYIGTSFAPSTRVDTASPTATAPTHP